MRLSSSRLIDLAKFNLSRGMECPYSLSVFLHCWQAEDLEGSHSSSHWVKNQLDRPATVLWEYKCLLKGQFCHGKGSGIFKSLRCGSESHLNIGRSWQYHRPVDAVIC